MDEWWLLDSGASRSVLSSKWLDRYLVVKHRKLDTSLSFSTASGQIIVIDEEVHVRCYLETYRQGRLVRTSTILRVLVADVQHNLLSTSQMVRMGWTITFSPDGVSCELKGSLIHPMLWAGVPWIKVVLPEATQSIEKSSSESPFLSESPSFCVKGQWSVSCRPGQAMNFAGDGRAGVADLLLG